MIRPDWLTRLCAEIGSCTDHELRAHVLQRALDALALLPDRDEREHAAALLNDALRERDD
jgi:hypothetical protein